MDPDPSSLGPGPVSIPQQLANRALFRRGGKQGSGKKLSGNERQCAGNAEAFYAAAQPAQAPLMYFDVKYYGVCESIPTDSVAPVMLNVTRLLDEKKQSHGAIKSQIFFSDKGLAVLERNAAAPTVSWFTHDIASMASVRHPLRPHRRIALLKVRNKAGSLEWHLFKYTGGKRDNMSESFRYIVNCSLRDIGRAVATGQELGRSPAAARADAAAAAEAGRSPQRAWKGADRPPRYDEDQGYMDVKAAAPPRGPAGPASGPARRMLDMDFVIAQSIADDAAAEADDIAFGMQRLSTFNGAAPLFDEPAYNQ